MYVCRSMFVSAGAHRDQRYWILLELVLQAVVKLLIQVLELNSCPLEEQCVLLTVKSPRQTSPNLLTHTDDLFQ